MKLTLFFLFSLFSFVTYSQKSPSGKEYNLLVVRKQYFPKYQKEMRVLCANEKDIKQLNEPLLALAAYYSAQLSSDCIDSAGSEYCKLTLALGLGAQGSKQHIELLQKWFVNDSDVKDAINRNCYVIAPGASMFCDCTTLKFRVRKDSVYVNYKIRCYDHGVSNSHIYKDIALIRKNRIEFVKNNP